MPNEKFVPHLAQLAQAAKTLPEAELWPKDTYVAVIPCGSRTMELTFRKIPYLSRAEGKTHRWAYEGILRVS